MLLMTYNPLIKVFSGHECIIFFLVCFRTECNIPIVEVICISHKKRKINLKHKSLFSVKMTLIDLIRSSENGLLFTCYGYKTDYHHVHSYKREIPSFD